MTPCLYVCSLAAAQAEMRREDPSMRGWSAAVAAPTPSDLVLFEAHWIGWEAREAFEAQAGVTPLGEAWEPVPAAAVDLLEAFRQALVPTREAKLGKSLKGGLAAAQDATAAIDATHTVAQALRKAAPHLR